MNTESDTRSPVEANRGKASRTLSLIFLIIWAIALTIAKMTWNDVPIYMLLIASIFFVMLLPSMIELVQEYDKFIDRSRKTSDAPANKSHPTKSAD
jgi:hypothetical protein